MGTISTICRCCDHVEIPGNAHLIRVIDGCLLFCCLDCLQFGQSYLYKLAAKKYENRVIDSRGG
jgi:hypothetical protein